MPEEKERPRPHGDPMRDEIDETNREENRAQRDSDAPADIIGEQRDRDRRSDANGVPSFDEAAGEERKRKYKDGAELVSGID